MSTYEDGARQLRGKWRVTRQAALSRWLERLEKGLSSWFPPIRANRKDDEKSDGGCD